MIDQKSMTFPVHQGNGLLNTQFSRNMLFNDVVYPVYQPSSSPLQGVVRNIEPTSFGAEH
jgi:hypothetical protein